MVDARHPALAPRISKAPDISKAQCVGKHLFTSLLLDTPAQTFVIFGHLVLCVPSSSGEAIPQHAGEYSWEYINSNREPWLSNGAGILLCKSFETPIILYQHGQRSRPFWCHNLWPFVLRA